MGDDIVTQLRAWSKEAPTLGQAFDLLHVADEIERLRAEVNSMASAQAGWGRVARLNDEIERLRAPLTMPEWIRLGVEHGWCSEPICGMHDGLPLVDDEIERFESGEEPCFTILRLHGPN